MKTLFQIQQELNACTKTIEQLSKDLSDMQKNDNAAKIDFSAIATIGNRYAFENHPLTEASEAVQKKYLEILATLTKYSKKPEPLWLFIQRLISSVKISVQLSELALSIEQFSAKDIAVFCEYLDTEDLRYSFAMDACIAVFSNKAPLAEQVEYMGTHFEFLCIDKNMLKDMLLLAKIIIKQDSNAYLDYCKQEHDFDLALFYHYIKGFHKGILSCNSKRFEISYDELTEVDITQFPQEIVSKKVLLKYVEFKSKGKDDNLFSLLKSDTILIQNSFVHGYRKYWYISKFDKLYIQNTKFHDMSYRALYIDTGNTCIIEECEFISCKNNDHPSTYSSISGGTMYLSSIKAISISNSNFEYCEIWNSEGSFANGALAHIANANLFEITNSTIKNCLSGRYYSYRKFDGSLIEFENCKKIHATQCKYGNSSNYNFSFPSIPYELQNGFSRL